MAESDWSQPSSWSAGGGSMWGAPQGGMQSPYGGGFGGYGGFQSPYGGGYGGFGGGMPYGGGWGMQSPYGAPGGYGGGYSPYGGMQSPYGGYGMQSPYGGYGMQSPYSAYGMPQQNQMMAGAPQAAESQTQAAGDPQAAPATTGDVTAMAEGDSPWSGLFDIKGNTSQTTTFTPWTPLGEHYERLWGGFKDPKTGQFYFTGAHQELMKQQEQGPSGFDPSSEAALARMEQLAQGGNPMATEAQNTTRDIMGGQAGINTGGMFSDMYGRPSISNAGQYQSMYDDPGITGQGQYDAMRGANAIGNAGQYNEMIGRDAIGGGRYEDLYRNNAVGEEGYGQLRNIARGSVGSGRMEELYSGASGPGSLTGGMFGRTASGEMVNSNPYREQAIQDAMDQTSDQVKATMSSRGRFGSDAYGDAMGKALGQVATQARMAGYDTDTANMMAAAQARSGEALSRQGVGLQAAQGVMNASGQNFQNQLAAMQGLTGAQAQNAAQRMGAAGGLAGLQGTNAAQRLAQIQGLSGIQGQNYQAQLGAMGQMNQAQQMANQQRMAAASGLSGIQGTNWQNQLGALQGMTGVQGTNLQNRMQAAGMAPTMQGLRYDDASRLAQAGAAREAMAQQQRNFGWEQLGQYRNMLGNLPGAAGQQAQETQQPWWQTALGLASGIGGIWGGMGGGA